MFIYTCKYIYSFGFDWLFQDVVSFSYMYTQIIKADFIDKILQRLNGMVFILKISLCIISWLNKCAIIINVNAFQCEYLNIMLNYFKMNISWNTQTSDHKLTSIAQWRMNFLAASLQIAGTVKTHFRSCLKFMVSFCFWMLVLKWSANALRKIVKMCFPWNSSPVTSSINRLSFIPFKTLCISCITS